MKTLETERLILRGWQESDAADMFEFAKSPNVGPNAGWKPHDNIDESIEIIKSFIIKDDVWAIVDKATSKVIGSLGLHNDDKRSQKIKSKMIGYVLSEDYWGRGFATEAVKKVLEFAFNELDLIIVAVGHYRFNQRSKRVIEKCGFKYEGTMRLANIIYNGTIYDDVCYSITKDEWKDLQL